MLCEVHDYLEALFYHQVHVKTYTYVRVKHLHPKRLADRIRPKIQVLHKPEPAILLRKHLPSFERHCLGTCINPRGCFCCTLGWTTAGLPGQLSHQRGGLNALAQAVRSGPRALDLLSEALVLDYVDLKFSRTLPSWNDQNPFRRNINQAFYSYTRHAPDAERKKEEPSLGGAAPKREEASPGDARETEEVSPDLARETGDAPRASVRERAERERANIFQRLLS